MTFSLSPAVITQEIDLTNIVPAVATNTAATVGQFNWGPVEKITIVDNEEKLATLFGTPTSTNYKDWFTASSYLVYASGLRLVRVVEATARNAAVTASVGGTGVLIKNQDHFNSLDLSAGTNLFAAKYPGTLGNSLGVAWANTAGYNDTDSQGEPTWLWYDLFSQAPGTNEFHIVVYDAVGTITGTVGTVLETFEFVSTTTTAMYFDGTSGYFKNRIDNGSKWIWVTKASLLVNTSNGVTFAGGVNGAAITDSNRQTGFALFQNTDTVDISIVFAAGAGSTTSKWIIDNVAEFRKDCLACVSPVEADVVNVFDATTALNNIKTTRNIYGSSSYAVMDSAYKYMYDRYNDVLRWVPLNGDIAGIIARTDNEYAAWFSPAGYEKGRIKNAIKLTLDQSKTFRDELYKVGINPCTILSGSGPLLFGDKTLLTRSSAFAHINVRRLFIVLEKAIATASKFYLFEQNNAQTRTRFVNMVEPFLRDIQGRQGITDFRVVCSAVNNTAEVVDRGEFVADIYIKPTRSIQVIRLSFVAVRTGVEFDEVVINTTAGTPSLV